MADDKKTFPKIPTRTWWTLRKRFKRSVPQKITISYLSSVLGGQEQIIKNWLPHFRLVGLTDEEDNTTDLANRWRHDDDYVAVCKEIRESVYPRELLDIDSGPDINRKQVRTWFARTLSLGEGAARHMTSFYGLLCKADLADGEKSTQQRDSRKRPKRIEKPKNVEEPKSEVDKPSEVQDAPIAMAPMHQSSLTENVPKIHIDIHIHISPEANKDQVDNIFKSMSKHLNLKKDN